MSGHEAPVCGARSKPVTPGRPSSDFICTQDRGHPGRRHTACDGQGHVLARWTTPGGPVEVWVPGRGRVVV